MISNMSFKYQIERFYWTNLSVLDLSAVQQLNTSESKAVNFQALGFHPENGAESCLTLDIEEDCQN
jgi:hypothetical protein